MFRLLCMMLPTLPLAQKLTCGNLKRAYENNECCGSSLDTPVGNIQMCIEARSQCKKYNVPVYAPASKGSVYWNSKTADNNPDFTDAVTLKGKLKTLAVGQIAPIAAFSRKDTFRWIVDDNFLYMNHVDGNRGEALLMRENVGGTFGKADVTYAPHDWSYDSAGLTTVIAKYDKCSLELLGAKSMKDMWIQYKGANIDSFGNIYPMLAPWSYKDDTGVDRGIIAGPFTTCRGPLAQYGDSLYVFNGNFDKLTLARVGKDDLKIKYAIEITDGERKNHPSYYWGKGVTVVPPKDTTKSSPWLKYPKVCLHTATHMLYTATTYTAYTKQPHFMMMNEGALHDGDDAANGKLLCYYDTDTHFAKAWEFSSGPKHLQAGDKLPIHVFPDDADFYRVWYDIALLRGKVVQGIAENGLTAAAGVNRVVLKSPKRKAVVYDETANFSHTREWEDPEAATIGYIRLEAGQVIEDSLLFKVWSDQGLSKCLKAYKNGQLVNPGFVDADIVIDGSECVHVQASYLMSIRHPIVYTLKRSAANVFDLDKQLAFSLNWFGGGFWFGSAGYDNESDTLFITTSQAQKVPLEESIRAVRAMFARPSNHDSVRFDWVDAGMGLDGFKVPPEFGVYGSEPNIYTNTDIDYTGGAAGLAPKVSERFAGDLWLNARKKFDELLANPSSKALEEATKSRADLQQGMTNLRYLFKSARSRRSICGAGFAAIRARDGAFLWGQSENPYQGKIEWNRMHKDHVLLLQAGSNTDNAENVVISTKQRRAITLTQKSSDLIAFDLSVTSEATSVSDDLIAKRDGVANNPIPFLTGQAPLGDLERSGLDAYGHGHNFGSNLMTCEDFGTECLEQYFGQSGFDGSGRLITIATWNGGVSTNAKITTSLTQSKVKQRMLNGVTYTTYQRQPFGFAGPSFGMITITVYNATTMLKIHDVLFYQPKLISNFMWSPKGLTILPDNSVTWGDGTNEINIIDYMTGELVNTVYLAEDHMNVLGPTVTDSKFIIHGAKEFRWDSHKTAAGPAQKGSLLYGISPWGLTAGP